MADWTVTLPDEAVEGETTHIEDHNAIVAAIAEARTILDQIEAAVGSHEHAASDITSGTLAAARIPTLAQSKVSGLADALENKVEVSQLDSLNEQLNAKAEQSDVEELAARVTALENPDGGTA